MSATSKPAAAQRVKSLGLLARLRAWRDQHLYSLVSSFGRIAQRPLSTGMTVGVMAVALALPLGLGLALSNLERFSGNVQASREIGVFLKTEVDATTAQRIADEIAARPDVAGVKLKSPAEGLAEFKAMSDLGSALDVLDDNPLPTVLLVQPRDDGAALAEALRQRPEVDLVQHDAVWRQRLSAWLAFGARVVWVLAALLGLGVLLVVGNTVRLEIGARVEEISILQQLGATDGFVRRPFLYLGAWYGLAAAALALALLALAGLALQAPLVALIASYGSQFRFDGLDWRVASAVLGGGLLLAWLGAWLATGHHLRRTRPTD